MPCILAIDQSTSATKVLLFDEAGCCLDRESREHRQYYPQPGWVEHDAEEIWQNLLKVTRTLVERNFQRIDDLIGVSITNQRETVVVFDRDTGQPLHPAIVWQCRRSNELCATHAAAGNGPLFYARTGLRLDPYFSASKLQWLVRNRGDLKAKLINGKALIGTIDTYLIYRLTGGKVFATDSTNASRTLLYDIGRLRWDKDLCNFWQVPHAALPQVRESQSHFGETDFEGILNHPLPIVGVMGDSQASLFAQRCFDPGTAKVTFGTGSSVLLNIGNKPKFTMPGVITALAWVYAGVPVYALEGIIINSAATLNWLQNQLNIVRDIAEIEPLASKLSDNGGVYLVPAFAGLGLPYWESNARAAIVGLTAHSDRRHIARAALESMAYQLRDVIDAMQLESGVALQGLRADGGPTANHTLMQFTANITATQLSIPATPDCSALGASLMGLLGLGVHSTLDSILQIPREDLVFRPNMPTNVSQTLYSGWQRAVQQVLSGVTK